VTTTPTTLVPVSIDQLDPAPGNRETGGLGDLEGLAASIKEVGIIQPIIVAVQAAGDRFTIVAGHRRHAAARLAGFTEVEVIVQAVDDDADQQRMMLIENLHREDLTAIDLGHGFATLADLGMAQREIAKNVGVSQATVSKHLSMLKLPKYAQEKIITGEIAQEDAVTLAGLPADLREKALEGAGIAWAKRQADARKAREEEVAQLKKDGVLLVDIADVDTPKGPKRLSSMFWVKAKDHKTADCRAVALGPNTTPVEVCTKPKNHPKPKAETVEKAPGAKKVAAGQGAGMTAGQRKASDAFNVLAAELDQASDRRREWLKALKPNPADAVRGTLEVMFARDECGVGFNELLSALDLQADDGFNNEPKALTILGRRCRSDADVARVLFLSVALMSEQACFDAHPGPLITFAVDGYYGSEADAYMKALIRLGYEPSHVECTYLGLPYEEPQMPGTGSPAAEEGASDAKATVHAAGEAPTVTVKEKSGKHYVDCTTCGRIGHNTNPDYAETRRKVHLEEHRTGKVAA
jgi:ParB/RepB/Spo0J family partition protein